MPPTVRAVPVSSREDALAVLDEIQQYPDAREKQEFRDTFGGTVEDWYYQEIEGRPYVIAVTDGGNLESGHSRYPDSKMPFFVWFRDRVAELSGVDLRENPKGAESEYLGRME